MVKILSDAESDQFWVRVVGPPAADLVQQIVIAIEMAASTEDLQLMVFGHPTMSEAVHERPHWRLMVERFGSIDPNDNNDSRGAACPAGSVTKSSGV